MRRPVALVASVLIWLAGPLARGADDPIGRILDEAEKSGRVPPETGTLEGLRNKLASAEEQLIHGDTRSATSTLFLIVEAPRYRAFADTAAFQNAEFQLGRALLLGHAVKAAERYLLRVVVRGPKAPYFIPAHRSLVDLALETRAYGRVLSALGSSSSDLPADAAYERSYLMGRVAYDRKDLDAAARHFGSVDRKSRFYAGAAYFRGLIAAREGSMTAARGAFCEIVGAKTRDGQVTGILRFQIDGRYLGLRDLAHLALGRVAHEQDRYDEAYYHYFSVPADSERLAEALFEAAWSLYQKGELRAARAFVDDFDKLFPQSPRRPEVQVLRANLALKSCQFETARLETAALERTFTPIEQQVTGAMRDPARARALLSRLLGRETSLGPTADDEGRILSLLRWDAGFVELQEILADLAREKTEARAGLAGWRTLSQALFTKGKVTQPASSVQAAELLGEVEALALGPVDPALAGRLNDLLIATTMAAYPAQKTDPFAAESAAAETLVQQTVQVERASLAAAEDVFAKALSDLSVRLQTILRQGRLVHIDAVVGRKKRLEIEIENLYAGRYPASLYTKLRAEGVLGDDEEYWPFEGEYWSDEYENYK